MVESSPKYVLNVNYKWSCVLVTCVTVGIAAKREPDYNDRRKIRRVVITRVIRGRSVHLVDPKIDKASITFGRVGSSILVIENEYDRLELSTTTKLSPFTST